MDRCEGFRAFDAFGDVTDPALYAPVPEGWVVGVTDVVHSTGAIAEGRYKAVNIAGAAAISGMINALGTRQFPFSFGGDGCAFAVPGADEAVAREVLGRTAAWVRDDLGLALRAAVVPVAAIREAGLDVRVAMFRPSPHVAYAMFDGGGVAWAEARMKAGDFAVAPAGAGERPDLSGLSCRWLPMRSRQGAMVSIIVRPVGEAGEAFRRAVDEVLGVLGEAGHPVPPAGPRFSALSPGLRLEALASRGGRALWRRVVGVAAHNVMGVFLFATGMKVGGFVPARYRALTSANADARKFGDALMVTADCDGRLEGEVRALLEARAAEGVLRYGLHRQDAALMTCIVPSYGDDGHFHFVDGAGGGYAAAARGLSGG